MLGNPRSTLVDSVRAHTHDLAVLSLQVAFTNLITSLRNESLFV